MLVSLAVAGPVFAGWQSSSASSSGANADVSCGSIQGNSGILTTWSTSSSQYQLVSSDGEVGAHWNGSYYPTCGGTLTGTQSTVTHTWSYLIGGRGKLQVQLTTSTHADGTATRDSNGPGPEPDTQWWWNPSVVINDTAPTVTRYNADGSVAQNVTYASNPDAYDHINVLGTGGVGGVSPPPPNATLNAGVAANAGGSTSGSFDATTGSISGTSGQTVRVVYNVNCTAGPDADNASVMNWKVYLKSTLTSSGVN
ncbi:MAG TPA: hypothetical protein VFS92_11585 [Planctomycetota bacterium]|nr:hypothetical protein [Planctomycetota bacterium]